MEKSNPLKTVSILIGIAVSCITIFYFVTGIPTLNLLGAKNSPAEEPPAARVERAKVIAEPTAMSMPENPPAPENTPTPAGIYNPSGSIMAGQPIIVDNYQLYLDEKSITINTFFSSTDMLVTLAVKNLDNRSRIFRFAPNSITIKDDTGRIYNYIEGRQCDSAAPYIETKAIQMAAGESVKIYSFDSAPSHWWWCLKGNPELLPWYEGDISAAAKNIIFEFNGFGPFSGFEVLIPID